MPDPEIPSVETLQFRRAQTVDRACAACKQPIAGEYFQVQNHVICPSCADKIRAGQQSPQSAPLLRPILYGLGAALAGCILYAIVLAMGVQIGIVALAVGWMVGRAMRKGSYGIGSRRLQILAVLLTYFAISTSFLPAAFMVGMKQAAEHKKTTEPPPKMTAGQAIAGLAVLATISPFLELGESPVGGLISLFILFIGLQRAWVMTGKQEILITGPHT